MITMADYFRHLLLRWYLFLSPQYTHFDPYSIGRPIRHQGFYIRCFQFVVITQDTYPPPYPSSALPTAVEIVSAQPV